MGAWGTAIFSDDFASDVRADFKEFLGEGLDSEDATRALEADYQDSLEDQDDGPVFWIALAVTQHGLGRLLPRVLSRALEAIDGGDDLRRWEEDPGLRADRAAVLAKVRADLLQAQPKAKRVPRRFRNENDWRSGQVVAYRLASGAYCAFHVIGHHQDRGGRTPVVRLFAWTGEKPPAAGELAGVGYAAPGNGFQSPQIMVGATSKRETPEARILVLPFEFECEESPEAYTVMLWRLLDGYLDRTFDLR